MPFNVGPGELVIVPIFLILAALRAIGG